VITICTTPDRCNALETAHSSLAAQLADAQGQNQQLTARLAAKDERIAELRAELDRVRGDYQFFYDGYCAKCAEKERVP
jgi:peptidoglycan hydrolase CwlO-like protein